MKKIELIIGAFLIFSSLIYADEISDIAKVNINKVVNVFLKNYTPIQNSNSSYSISFKGKLIESNDTILVIYLEKQTSELPSTYNFPAKMYIRINEIAAIQISEK